MLSSVTGRFHEPTNHADESHKTADESVTAKNNRLA